MLLTVGLNPSLGFALEDLIWQDNLSLLTSYTPTGAVATTLLPILASDHVDLIRILP